ncbi:hypothetical protein LCGC14_3113030, partial [marine sediment metagenome]
MVADGEGEASPSLLAWAEEGLVDVIQYDILSYGFTAWLALGGKLVLLPRFDEIETLQAIQEHRATMFEGVPTMY